MLPNKHLVLLADSVVLVLLKLSGSECSILKLLTANSHKAFIYPV